MGSEDLIMTDTQINWPPVSEEEEELVDFAYAVNSVWNGVREVDKILNSTVKRCLDVECGQPAEGPRVAR